jgi:hypothetical protein
MHNPRIDEIAARVLALTHVDPTPPIDLISIARELGVDTVAERSMVEDGRLEQRADRTVIYLRSGTRKTRQRFTLAHELGHLILANPDQEFVARRMWPGVGREERFCDEFAAALLLPRRWIIQQARDKPATLATARTLAETCDASLSATVVRLRSVLDWHSSLLQWRRIDDRWRLALSAGVPPEAHNRITSDSTTSPLLDAAQRTSRQDQRCVLPLRIAGVSRQVDAELSVRGASAVALARL